MVEGLSSETGASVLFVDDDPDVLTSAQVLLERNGFRFFVARSPAEAWSVLAAEPIDVILLDLNFARGATSGAEGFAWLAEIRAHDPDAVVVVVTGHSGINIAVAAMKAGASDFVMKPWNNPRFLETVRAAAALRRRSGGDDTPALDDDLLLVGDSPPMKRVRDLVARAAPTGAAVLIHGEAGTGKDLVARLLHARSGRAGAFVRIDVRGLGEDAADAVGEAALEARGGTLFLDEVADLSTPAQARLLAVLDAGPDLRLVSATRRGGEGLIRLRDDLLGRLNTVEIALPTLAARGDDLTLLLEHFVRLFARRYDRPPKPLDTSAVEMLRVQPPPGQVRGLRQAAERAVVLSESDVLTAADFAAPASGAERPTGAPDFNLSRSERSMVEAALKRHGHNVSQAARDLGLTRAALYRRMVKHGL
ncbi:sigma-54 dependent transcriptional regulator [Phenylobacterium sp.]|uniref:sigma-54-dependent transcriptional regulator n=1 Tax=Phenylobacterium sp. TaxID=1871053 RepID=UPI002B6BE07E|nr:sigma-54 dependent transcriptional regulator [Phenylobacterium sp.]HLZ73652.1 sigma-54 dependent transcriptional regulator [Phenylobacterium sp.]